MGSSIGSILTDLGAMRAQLMAPTTRPASGAAPSSGSFADQLDASFRARAQQLGLDLPAAPATTALPGAAGDDVNAIWQRAQLQSAAANGPGDAMMQAIGEAADARWDRLHGRDERDLFDL